MLKPQRRERSRMRLVLPAFIFVLVIAQLVSHSVRADPRGIDFTIAAKTGDLGKVNAMLADGLDVDIAGEKRLTALMWASRTGQFDVVTRLLKAGADVSVALGAYQQPALAYASEFGHLEIVRMLLEAGANPNQAAATRWGNPVSILVKAASNGNLETVSMLVNAGADVNKTFDGGNSPIMAAVSSPDVFDYLLSQGADTRYVNAANVDLLNIAVMSKSADVVRRIVKVRGQNLNRLDSQETSALMRASYLGLEEIAEILISAGADVNQKGPMNRTPDR